MSKPAEKMQISKSDVEPGIYDDLTNEQYHNGPGLSKSGVSKILQSPAHYWASYIDPEREPFQETEAMRIGSAAHKWILEPNTFSDEFEIVPDNVAYLNKNTNAYKGHVASVRERGRIPILPDQMEKIRKMGSRVISHPTASLLVSGGKAEQSFFWIDSDTGVLCKCRPDYWIPGLALPDLKTTNDARDKEFSKSCANYDYHIQAAFYSDGVQAMTGEQLPMPFIALEKESPFAISVFNIDEPDINRARTQYKRALEIYSRCMETDSWPAYPPEVRTISLPNWSK